MGGYGRKNVPLWGVPEQLSDSCKLGPRKIGVRRPLELEPHSAYVAAQVGEMATEFDTIMQCILWL